MKFLYALYIALISVSFLAGSTINGSNLNYKKDIFDIISKNASKNVGQQPTRILIINFKDILSTNQKQTYFNQGMKSIKFVSGNKQDGYDYRMYGEDDSFVRNFNTISRSQTAPASFATQEKVHRVNQYILSNQVPDYSKDGNDSIFVNISFIDDISIDEIKKELQDRNIALSHLADEKHKVIIASINPNQIDDILSIPFVIFIDMISPPNVPYNKDASIYNNATPLFSFSGGNYNLSGKNINVQVIDGGKIRSTHNEFMKNGISKVTLETSASMNAHATHVAGTIGAYGVNPQARGMAIDTKIFSYWFNDSSQNYDQVIDSYGKFNTKLSNHSYGYNIDFLPDDYLSKYISVSNKWDKIVKRNPSLLIFKAAGNDRDQGNGTYKILTDSAVSKNVFVIGASSDSARANPKTDGITWFSSFGPTKDGRIKPDFVANGDSLYSSVETSNSAYASKSGTSMATPATTGMVALILEEYKNLTGVGDLRADILKSLLMNTSTDLGNEGPDYGYGYGMINAKKAVDTLRTINTNNSLFVFDDISHDGIIEYDFTLSQETNVSFSVSWIDKEGDYTANQNDMLVNDIDMILIEKDDNITYYPWTLDVSNPSSPAIKTKNNHIDNSEQIQAILPAGNYKIKLRGYEIISDDKQDFALVSNIPLDITKKSISIAIADSVSITNDEQSISFSTDATDVYHLDYNSTDDGVKIIFNNNEISINTKNANLYNSVVTIVLFSKKSFYTKSFNLSITPPALEITNKSTNITMDDKKIFLTFNRNILAGEGNISLYNSSNNLVETIRANDNSKVSIIDKVVNATFTNNLSLETYSIRVDNKAFKDSDGTYFNGASFSVVVSEFIDGTKKWEFETGAGISSSPAISHDGTIYIGSRDNKLYALSSDGSKKWDFETGGYVLSSPAISNDGTIYIGSKDKKLYALSSDGTKKWEFDTGNSLGGSPAISNDGTIYIGSADSKLYALDSNGTKKWEFETGKYISSSPAISNDGTIYIVSGDHKIYALDSNGTKKWEFETEIGISKGISSSPAISNDGTIYFGSEDKKLYALNPDGTKKWEFETGNVIVSSPAISNDGTIYFGSWDGKLYALNPNGTKKWEFEMGEYIASSPAISKDGTIYIGSQNNKLYALNPDGTKKWEFETGKWLSSSPAISKDGTIYIGSDDKKLYAIHSNSGGLANSAWPTFGQNNQRTGTLNTYRFQFTSGNTFSIEEGNKTVTKLTVNSDNNIAYDINGTNANLFDINKTSGEITFKVAPIYQSSKSMFEFNATAKDGDGNIAIMQMIINITTLPKFDNPTTNEFDVSQGETFVTTLNARDDSNIIYGLNSDDASSFNIDSSGRITFKQAPVYAIKSIYRFNATARDVDGNIATMNIIVNIITAPVFSSPTATFRTNEGNLSLTTLLATDDSSIIYEINGTDASSFNLNPNSGKVTFKQASVYANKSIYNFNAIAIDTDGNKAVMSITVYITILPTFDNPTTNEFNVSGGNTFVGTFKATDDSSITYGLNSYDASSFNIDSSGKVTFKQAPVYANKSRYQFEVTARDVDGYVARMIVTVNIITIPVFTSPSIVSVKEYRLNALTLLATDDSSITYSISGGDFAYFNLNASTGKITFKTAPIYATKTSYSFTATATDNDGDKITMDITINITEDLHMKDLLSIKNNMTTNDVKADVLLSMNALIAELETLLEADSIDVASIQAKLTRLHYYEQTFNDNNGLGALKISGTINLNGRVLTPVSDCLDDYGKPLSSCKAIFIDIISTDDVFLGSTMVGVDGKYSVYMSDKNTNIFFKLSTHFNAHKEHYYRDFGNDNTVNGIDNNADSFKYYRDIGWSRVSNIWVLDINHLKILETSIEDVDFDLSDINSNVHILKANIKTKAKTTRSQLDVMITDVDTGKTHHTVIFIDANEDNASINVRLPKQEAKYSFKIVHDEHSMYLDDEKDVDTDTSDHSFDGDEALINNKDIQWTLRNNIWIQDIAKTGYFTINSSQDIGDIDISKFGDSFHKIEGIVSISDFDINKSGNYMHINIISAKTGRYLAYSSVDSNYKYSILLGESIENDGYTINIHQTHYDNIDTRNSYYRDLYMDFDINDNSKYTMKDRSDVIWNENNSTDNNITHITPANINPFKIASSGSKIHTINIDFSNYTKPKLYSVSGTISGVPSDAKWVNIIINNPKTYYNQYAKLTNNNFEFINIKEGNYLFRINYYSPSEYKRHRYLIYGDSVDFSSSVNSINANDVRNYPFDASGNKIENNDINSTNIAYWAPYEDGKEFRMNVNSDIEVSPITISETKLYSANIKLSNAGNNKNVDFNLFIPNESIGQVKSNTSIGGKVDITLDSLKEEDNYHLKLSVTGTGDYWYDSSNNVLVSNVYWVGKQNGAVCNDWRNNINNCDINNYVTWTPNINGFSINEDKTFSLALPDDKSTLSATLKLGNSYINKTVWVDMREINSTNSKRKEFTADSSGDVDFNISVKKSKDYIAYIGADGFNTFAISLGDDNAKGGSGANKDSLISSQNIWQTSGRGAKQSVLLDMSNDVDLGDLAPPSLSVITLSINNLQKVSGKTTENIYISIFKDDKWYGKDNADYSKWPTITYNDEVKMLVPNGSYYIMIHPSKNKSGLANNGNNNKDDTLSGTINNFNWDWGKADLINVSGDSSYTIELPDIGNLKSIEGVVNINTSDKEGWISASSNNEGKGAVVNKDGSFRIEGLSAGTYTLRYFSWNQNQFNIVKHNVNINADISNFQLTKDVSKGTINGIVKNITAGENNISVLLLDVYDTNSDGSYGSDEWKVAEKKDIGSLSNGASSNYAFALQELEENHIYVVAIGIKTINTSTGETTFVIYEAINKDGNEVNIGGIDNSVNTISNSVQ